MAIILSIAEKLLRFLHPLRSIMLPLLVKLRSIYFWTEYAKRLIGRRRPKVLTEDDYTKAYEVVAHNEGFKFTTTPGDHGGPTKGGVTQKFLDSHGIKMNVMDLTEPQRKEIFRDYVWNPCKYDTFKDPRIATKVFDMNVNMGAYQAHLLLQRAVDHVNPGSVKVDGYIGPLTIAAANNCNQDELLAALREQSVSFYDGLVDKDGSQAKFLKGWLNRAWE